MRSSSASDSVGGLVVGVDSGGSGLRIALARTGTTRTTGTDPAGAGPDAGGRVLETIASGEPVRTGPGGIDAGHLLAQVLPAVEAMAGRATGAVGRDGGDGGDEDGGRIVAVAVGAAGMATLGERLRAELPGALERAWGVRRLALAADAVTAYAGALGQRPGAVVAGGTGLIALGTDLSDWRRADGWGHLLGDCGSGAWIGRAGLEAAMRAYDGRRGGSTALLARAEERFGPASGLPAALYPRTDRPAVLASFAPEVAGCAVDGDAVAAGILERAAGHIAEAAAAVCPAGPAVAGEVALTGGLFRMGEPLLGPLRAELGVLLPEARVVDAAGDPLSGAVAIAAALARDALRLPQDPRLLQLTR
ncbi:BadF/BadG/BcrA/BcrD ATPase family protein [Streptomyces sp. NPDC006339]|uniref:N-acetylglucosamine kinase n=1 Tax=Streptomyces sp. NPDC006339 TaxID=3156755 RepID=UPI0033B7696A